MFQTSIFIGFLIWPIADPPFSVCFSPFNGVFSTVFVLWASYPNFGILVFLINFLFLIFIFGNLKKSRLRRKLKNILGENEQKFLDFLLLNYNQGYVNGHQLIAFFGRHKSAPESQRQFRSKLIDNFTKSLSLIFQDKNILDIQQDEKDQRKLNYRLNSKIYKILSKL